jgi:uncharacterized protein (TIGR02300 family)
VNEILFERGTKRTCQSCASRFYDLARVPVICPKCGADYIEIVRPVTPPYKRRGRGVFGPSEPVPVEENNAPESEAEEGEEDEARELDGEGEPEAEDEREAAEE